MRRQYGNEADKALTAASPPCQAEAASVLDAHNSPKRRSIVKATAITGLVMTGLALATLPANALGLNLGGSGSVGVSIAGDDGADLGASASVAASANASIDGDDSASADGSVDAGLAADGGGDASVGADAGLAADDQLAVVIDLIANSDWTSSSFSAITNVSATVYDVNALVTAENALALDAALTANADDVAELQAALGANAELSALLEASESDASAAIAAGVAADGSLVIFTQ
jgi:hypothetical protein